MQPATGNDSGRFAAHAGTAATIRLGLKITVLLKK
jgi:hypothetical protein